MTLTSLNPHSFWTKIEVIQGNSPFSWIFIQGPWIWIPSHPSPGRCLGGVKPVPKWRGTPYPFLPKSGLEEVTTFTSVQNEHFVRAHLGRLPICSLSPSMPPLWLPWGLKPQINKKNHHFLSSCLYSTVLVYLWRWEVRSFQKPWISVSVFS